MSDMLLGHTTYGLSTTLHTKLKTKFTSATLSIWNVFLCPSPGTKALRCLPKTDFSWFHEIIKQDHEIRVEVCGIV